MQLKGSRCQVGFSINSVRVLGLCVIVNLERTDNIVQRECV